MTDAPSEPGSQLVAASHTLLTQATNSLLNLNFFTSIIHFFNAFKPQLLHFFTFRTGGKKVNTFPMNIIEEPILSA